MKKKRTPYVVTMSVRPSMCDLISATNVLGRVFVKLSARVLGRGEGGESFDQARVPRKSAQ